MNRRIAFVMEVETDDGDHWVRIFSTRKNATEAEKEFIAEVTEEDDEFCCAMDYYTISIYSLEVDK